MLSGTNFLTDCQAAQDIKWGIVRVLRCSGIDEELGSEGEGRDGRSEGCGVDEVGKRKRGKEEFPIGGESKDEF